MGTSTHLIIRNGTLVAPNETRRADIAIADGKIQDISDSVGARSASEIDAHSLLIFPGLIDSHVHFNEPGRTEWEGFTTGSAALAAGGGTCFFDMPLNASPPTLDGESFDLKRRAAEASSIIDFGLWGGLTPVNLDRMEELAECGVIGFKAFMCDSGICDFPAADEAILRRGMAIAAKLGLLVAVHAESETITAARTAGVRARGGKGWRDFLDTRPLAAELEAIQRAIDLAAETNCSLHIVHVSHPEGVELVRRAATSRIADVTCETCPHYLALCDDDLPRLGAAAKCAPPLRSRADMERLWSHLSDDSIAFVASDHSPAPPSMKTGDDAFAAWGGIAGVQSTLAILLSHRPMLPPPRVAVLTADNVASRFRIPRKGRIQIGYDADLVLVDPSQSYELKREDLLDRHKQSPYVGRRFTGRVVRTMARGKTVCLDGKIVGSAGHAKLVTPQR